MEAPLFFRRPELTPPLSLPDERRLADAGQLDDLRVGMVFKQSHCMVKLLGVEFGRAALTEIPVVARATALPSCVRCTIMSRSNCANDSSTLRSSVLTESLDRMPSSTR